MGGLQLVELISGCSPRPLFSEEEGRGYEQSRWVGKGLYSGSVIMRVGSLESGAAGPAAECISDMLHTGSSARGALCLAKVIIT